MVASITDIGLQCGIFATGDSFLSSSKLFSRLRPGHSLCSDLVRAAAVSRRSVLQYVIFNQHCYIALIAGGHIDAVLRVYSRRKTEPRGTIMVATENIVQYYGGAMDLRIQLERISEIHHTMELLRQDGSAKRAAPLHHAALARVRCMLSLR